MGRSAGCHGGFGFGYGGCYGHGKVASAKKRGEGELSAGFVPAKGLSARRCRLTARRALQAGFKVAGGWLPVIEVGLSWSEPIGRPSRLFGEDGEAG